MAKRYASKINTSRGNVLGRRSDGRFGKTLAKQQVKGLKCERTVNDGK